MANQRVVEVIENRFHLSKHLLTNVLQKLNDKQFDKIAIVSVIGPHFEGNTFTANLILNYLQRECTDHKKPDQWPHNVVLRQSHGFNNVDNCADDCGQPMGPRVEMWSEPFIVRRGNIQVAVLLVNVQNFAYTLADLIRGDTLLIHMFRLISSISTIVIINRPGLKQHPLGSGHKYMIQVNSYIHFLITLNQWQYDNYDTLMANVSQITDRSDNYRKLDEEFNKNGTCLVSCPAYDVKNIDWKVGELSREYADQMNTFISVDALDFNNYLNGITFTNTNHLMKVISGKINALNHNNSVNTGQTPEPHVVPDKHPAPTSRTHQSSTASIGKMAFDSKYRDNAKIGDPLVRELMENFTALTRNSLNYKFEFCIKRENFDTIFEENSKKVMNLFDRKWSGLEIFRNVYLQTLRKLLDDQKVIYTNFDSKYNSFVANCQQLCDSDEYFIDSKQLKHFLLTDEEIKELFKNDYYLCKKYNDLTESAINSYSRKISEINVKNKDKCEKSSKMAIELYDKEMSGLLKSGTFTDQTFRQKYNTVCDTIWTRVADTLSLRQCKPNVINVFKEGFLRYTKSVGHNHFAKNRQNHQFIKTEINNILLQNHNKYCTHFAAKLSKTGFIDSKQFDKMHKQLLDQLLSEQEQQVMAYKTRFADTYLGEICAKNRENIALNINHTKAKYWALNESKRNKSQTFVMDFECKPIGVYYSDKNVGTVHIRDPHRHRTSNCVAFDGQNIFHGWEAEQYLNGRPLAIKDIMGRDVTDYELNEYNFDFVDKIHPKVRLIFNNDMNYDLYIESLFALQVLGAKRTVEEVNNNHMKNMVFIVPTNYTIRQLNAFQDAATIAGIEHVQFITEMSSLAIDFGFSEDRNNRNTAFPYVLIILLTDSGCELALVEYPDKSVKYKAYKSVDIDWPAIGGDFSAVNYIFIDCLQQLFNNMKKDPQKLKQKIYDCFIIGEKWRALGIDFKHIMHDYCTELTYNYDRSAIIRGAVYYSKYYETNGHNIPITGVLFRDIIFHINSGAKVETLLSANVVPKHFPRVQYKLNRSDPFPMTVRITEGTDSVIKEYVLIEYPTGYKHSQTLFLYITIASDLDDKNCIDLKIDFEIGMNNMRHLTNSQSLELIFNLTRGQISEQTELIANLIKPVSFEPHCSHDKPIVYDCDYYSNNTNAMTFTTNETKSDEINKHTNDRSKPVTKKRPAVTENELGTFVIPLIQKYTELISQLSNTCDPDTQVYASKSRDLRNRVMKEFDTEFGRKEPKQLVADEKLILITLLDNKDMECMTKAKEMMAKSDNKLQELIESCVKEFNDKMIAAIDEDIEMNGVDNNYNRIYSMVNISITNLFNNQAMSLSKREIQRKTYLSRLTQNISNCVEKYKYLYDCNERYQQICRQQIELNRNLPDVVLRDMQRAVDVPHVLLSNSQLMERLHKMYDKSYRYFTTASDKIRADEQQLADKAIELIVVKYRELFHHMLMSKFYTPSDLNAIHNQLVSECLALLKQSCAFTTAQSDLEDMWQQKCEGQLGDAFTHIKVDYTAKLRRLFALYTNIVKDMHRKYCHNIDRHLATDFGDEDQLQRLLETEFIDIMNTFAARIDPIGREWDRDLVRDIEQKHRQSLNRVLFERMREYRIANSRRVSFVSDAIPAQASPPVANPIQEFSQLCADINARLETCGAIATKKRRISLKLVECQQIVTTNADRLDEQKLDLFRLIDLFKLRDKLIIG